MSQLNLPPGVQATIRLPDVVHLVLPAQHAVVILEALGEHGPYKIVAPVLQNVESQLIGQQAKAAYVGPPPGRPEPIDPPAPAVEPPAAATQTDGPPADVSSDLSGL